MIRAFSNLLKILPALVFCAVMPRSATAQNVRVDGYKGIWFTLGQFSQYGDKYSGGLGTYTSSHIPIAVYAKAVDKTFFVYGGTTAKADRHLLIMLSYYDHQKHLVPKPVIVYDKIGVDDPHDNAALSIDAGGYIWVFVSGRNTSRPGIIFKSRKPYGIDNFEEIKQGEMTYPQPWWLKDHFFYLFTKYTRGRELYWTTSGDGNTWTPEQKLAGMGGHYQVSNSWKGKVVSVFNYHPGGDVDKRTNLYLVQTDDNGKSWTTIDGQLLQTPLTDPHTAALIKDYESEGRLVYLNDVNFDKDGNPVILAVVSRDFKPGPHGNPHEWFVIYRKEGRWNFRKVCESTHNYDMGSLYIEREHWKIIGPTEPGPQQFGTGGEMALWESSNAGQDWMKAKQLTTHSSRNHSYARRPLNAHPDFYAFWADGNADSLSESKLYFCNSKGEVSVLPYDMKKDFERPVRLDEQPGHQVGTKPRGMR
jgi:hypothetical protein